MMTDKTQAFPTYNALGRAALVFGVPLVPLAALVGGSLVLRCFYLLLWEVKLYF